MTRPGTAIVKARAARKPRATKPKVLCGALTRNEETKSPTCRQPAGWGTDHPGQGRCKLHGGATPITTGRYSKVTNERVRDLTQEFEGDPDPLNIYPELASARALYVDYIERYEQITKALLAWHASFTQVGALNAMVGGGLAAAAAEKPRQILDISDAYRLLAEITKIAEREWKRHEANAITRKDMNRLIDQMGREVMKEVTDKEKLKRIRNGWLSLAF